MARCQGPAVSQMVNEVLSYAEWAVLSWAAGEPQHRCFYIVRDKVISQFEFTSIADKAVLALVQKECFTATDYRCYRINDRGLMLANATAPAWQYGKLPVFGQAEYAVLSGLYDHGGGQEWVSLEFVPDVSRVKVATALRALIAHGLANAKPKFGDSLHTQDTELRPALFKDSRKGWRYMLTDLGIEKLCELDLEQQSA
ncbi:MAG: hypothetical protein RSD49_06715 [Hafnia sp.]